MAASTRLTTIQNMNMKALLIAPSSTKGKKNMIIIQPKSGRSMEGLSFEEYLKLPETNQSYIKTLITKSPLHAQLGSKEETSSMSVGTLAHSIVFGELIPEQDLAPYSGTRRGAAWETFKVEAIESGKQPVTAKEFDTCSAMGQAIPDYVRSMIKDTHKERTIQFDVLDLESEAIVKCKARIDIMDSSMIADYKTTSKGISPREFKSSIGKYYYDLQACWYRSAVMALTGVELPFYWIVQESQAPYDVNIFEASPDLINNGKEFMNFGIQRYCQCLADNDFHGHFKGSPVELDAPEWHIFDPELDTTNVKEVNDL